MRILIVCQYYSPEPFRVSDVAEELSKAGHVVSVLTGNPNYPEGSFYPGFGSWRLRTRRRNGVTVVRVPIVPRGKGGAARLILNYASFVLSGCAWALRCRPGLYDAVLVYQLSPIFMAIPAIIAASRSRAPLLLYVVDLWPESLAAEGNLGGRAVAITDRIVRWIYRHCNTVLMSSSGFRSSIVSHGFPASRTAYVPQYAEDFYRPVIVADDDPARGELPSGFRVVFTGNVGRAQGLGVVLDAAEELREKGKISWVIIGDGRARQTLQEAARRRRVEEDVVFLGRRAAVRIPVYLALCDAALISLRPEALYAATLPAKVQSYLACGIPLLGCAPGETERVILESGAGLAGAAGDAHALAENVLAMYRSSAAERRRFAQNGLRYHEKHFLKSRILDDVQGFLDRAVRRPA